MRIALGDTKKIRVNTVDRTFMERVKELSAPEIGKLDQPQVPGGVCPGWSHGRISRL
ncbi:MAG: hypothetical protein U0P46_12170 [Holophagaceae bacterium]